jgi:hypothetical protein
MVAQKGTFTLLYNTLRKSVNPQICIDSMSFIDVCDEFLDNNFNGERNLLS